MRGSSHNKDICEFNIDDQGMHIGRAFRNVTGILAGNPVFIDTEELDRLSNLLTGD